jgi:hypothetical protein
MYYFWWSSSKTSGSYPKANLSHFIFSSFSSTRTVTQKWKKCAISEVLKCPPYSYIILWMTRQLYARRTTEIDRWKLRMMDRPTGQAITTVFLQLASGSTNFTKCKEEMRRRVSIRTLWNGSAFGNPTAHDKVAKYVMKSRKTRSRQLATVWANFDCNA